MTCFYLFLSLKIKISDPNHCTLPSWLKKHILQDFTLIHPILPKFIILYAKSFPNPHPSINNNEPKSNPTTLIIPNHTTGLLLDRHHPGLPERHLRRPRALRPAPLAQRLPHLHRDHLSRHLHPRDEHQILRARQQHVLPLPLQQIRLHRHLRQRHRARRDLRLSGPLLRHLGPPLPAPPPRLQSNTLLDVAAQPGHLTDQLDALHHQPALPPLPLHPHIRAARHAAVRRHLELRRLHALGQLQPLSDRHAHRVPDTDGRGLERGDVQRDTVEGRAVRVGRDGERLLHHSGAVRQLHAAECVLGDCGGQFGQCAGDDGAAGGGGEDRAGAQGAVHAQ